MSDKIAKATNDMKQNNNFGIQTTIVPSRKHPEDSPAYVMTIRKDSPAYEAFLVEHSELVAQANAVQSHEASRVTGKYYNCYVPSEEKTLMLQRAQVEKRIIDSLHAETPMYVVF